MSTRNENERKRYRQKKIDGICVRCPEPAYRGGNGTYKSTLCLNHMYSKNEERKKWYRENIERERKKAMIRARLRKENNECVCCGLDLLEEDGNLVSCVTCRTKGSVQIVR